MRSIAAACLLLAGVIIGLVISNSRQQPDNAALDQLVKQIQERDRQKRELAQNIRSCRHANRADRSGSASRCYRTTRSFRGQPHQETGRCQRNESPSSS